MSGHPHRRSARSAHPARPAKHHEGRAARGLEAVEQLRVDGLAAGGAGVAKLSSGAVAFITGAAPGELVEAAVNLAHRPARGRVLRVIEPSADRVTPPCMYVASCGGCDWMHIASSAQRAAHVAIVRSALEHAIHTTTIGSLPAVRSHEPTPPLEYRTRARLFARAHRGAVSVGYRAAASRDLAAIDACLVLDPSIAKVIGDLPAVLRGASGEGDALLARGASSLPVVELLWRGDLAPSTWSAIDERVRSRAWAGARVVIEGVTRGASFGDPRACMEGADGAPLVIAPGGFAQTSDAGASALARRVSELARLDPDAPAGGSRPLHTVELFAGSGTLSILLARSSASFMAVEIGEESVACLRENFAARGLTGKLVVADADALSLPARTELVVLDPPRAGAAGAVRSIIEAGPAVVVYVACDPATLARDVAALTGGGYLLTHVETFELFPQTSHVEVVVRLARAKGGVKAASTRAR